MSPLSEREQKILEEIEKNLHAEDPRLARATARRHQSARIRLGVVLFIAGFVALFAFFISRALVVGVGAFGAMVAGIVLLAGSLKHLASGEEGDSSPGSRLRDGMKRWERTLRDRYRKGS